MKKLRRPPVPVPQDAVYISINQVRARYGNISHMWVERKIKTDPRFPQPKYFGRLRFFKISEVEEYERLCVTEPAP